MLIGRLMGLVGPKVILGLLLVLVASMGINYVQYKSISTLKAKVELAQQKANTEVLREAIKTQDTQKPLQEAAQAVQDKIALRVQEVPKVAQKAILGSQKVLPTPKPTLDILSKAVDTRMTRFNQLTE